MGFSRLVVHGFYERVDTERKLNVHMTPSERLMYVQFTSCVYAGRAEAMHTKSLLYYMKALINLLSILPVNNTIFIFQKRDSTTFKPPKPLNWVF